MKTDRCLWCSDNFKKVYHYNCKCPKIKRFNWYFDNGMIEVIRAPLTINNKSFDWSKPLTLKQFKSYYL